VTTSAAARMAAHLSRANTADRAARTAPGRAGLEARFVREARGRLGPDAKDRQVADAAGSARKAHFLRLSAASAKARRERAQ
jgi:hypothetical protein